MCAYSTYLHKCYSCIYNSPTCKQNFSCTPQRKPSKSSTCAGLCTPKTLVFLRKTRTKTVASSTDLVLGRHAIFLEPKSYARSFWEGYTSPTMSLLQTSREYHLLDPSLSYRSLLLDSVFGLQGET